jgi:hypothetical protein
MHAVCADLFVLAWGSNFDTQSYEMMFDSLCNWLSYQMLLAYKQLL